jgi:outer membrane receptor protein involved in Fe transport
VNSATFATQLPGIAHRVPNVPPVVLRIDATARGKLTTIDGTPLTGRIGAGYTYAAGRYLTDAIRAPSNSILNAAAAIRYDRVELGIDVYNLADTRYADDAQLYVSNWSFQPGQQPASVATHVAAAPPRTLLASISLYF